MPKLERLKRLKGSINYAPYFACLLGIDAEWSRRRSQAVDSPYIDIQNRLADLCQFYASGIKRNCVEMHGTSRCEVPLHLFNPVFYMPWGHADVQALVLLDDFECIHHITSCLESSIEEVSFGFCPLKTSLDIQGDDPYFVELDDHLFEGFNDRSQGSRYHSRPFQDLYPLMVFTRYKVDALAQIGFALTFQEALFRAIRSSVCETMDYWVEPTPLREGIEYELGDRTKLKIAIIDLQGAEEIGSLMFCQNYSVAMSVMAGLRNLTYERLFSQGQIGERLKKAISDSRVFDRLMRIQPSSAQGNSIESILDNHVFRWTHTTLSVAPNAFFAESGRSEGSCHGYVSAVAEFQVPPGHLGKVSQKVIRHPADRAGASADPPPNVAMYEVGRGDLLVPFTSTDNTSSSTEDERATTFEPPPGYLPLRDVIKICVANLEEFGRIAEFDTGRDVVDCSTVISVPIPRFRNFPQSVGKRHLPLFGSALREIQRRLFYPDNLPSDERTFTDTGGRLRLDHLRSIPRIYGVPVTLRRNIECLYQNYAILMGDYYEFDSVIDLYDSFATLHATLTERLKHARDKELQGAVQTSGVPLLDDRRVATLSSFVEAQHNALSHRLTRSFSDPVIRDMSIDLRGGLNQVVAAADVPMKCGLGLLRKHAIGNAHDPKRDIVGGLTRISLRPGMRARSLNLGTGESSHLCYVEADVPHVLHVASFCDYLHEAAHLIFESLTERYPDSPISKLGMTHEEATDQTFAEHGERLRFERLQRTRLNEIFAFLFTRLFIFAGQPLSKFIVHQLIVNEKSRNGPEANALEMVEQVSELLVRLCIAEQLMPGETNLHDASAGRSRCSFNLLTDKYQRQNSIEKVIVAGSHALPECQTWWKTGECDGWRHCVAEFEHIYCDLEPYLSDLQKWAVDVYQSYCSEVGVEDVRSVFELKDQWRDFVQDCIDNGYPLVRQRVKLIEDESDADAAGIDPLMLACTVLSVYVTRAEIDPNNELILPRHSETGKIDIPRDSKGWNAFLIDRGAAAMFSCIPEERGQRLQQQIAILKTFWDMASHFRGRRLCEIIEDNWPELGVTSSR